jgi:hypothetical protein
MLPGGRSREQVPHWRDKMGPEYKVMQLIFAWRAINATGCSSQ